MTRWTGRRVLLHLVLVIGAVLAATPLLWMVSASFMPAGSANASPPPLVPSAPTLEHYRALFTSLNLGRYFINSLVISIGGTLLAVTITGLAGFAFAKLRFTGRDATFR
ncbi:MAG: carbohydrate ABC transporter permease, partial [Gemmatimonadales bacterium]